MIGLIESRSIVLGTALTIAIVCAGCTLTRQTEAIEGKAFDIDLKSENGMSLSSVGLKAGAYGLVLLPGGTKLQLTTAKGVVDTIDLSQNAIKKLMVTSNRHSDEYPHRINFLVDGRVAGKPYTLRVAIEKKVVETKDSHEMRYCPDNSVVQDRYREDTGIFTIEGAVLREGPGRDSHSTTVGSFSGDTNIWTNKYRVAAANCE